MASEKELVDMMIEAEKELHEARSRLSEAKKRWTDAETNVINAKLHVGRLAEELRIIRAQKVIPGMEYDLYDDEG